MNRPKFNQNAATISADQIDSDKLEKAQRTQNPVTINNPSNPNIVPVQQQQTRGKVMKFLATLGFGVALGAGGLEYYSIHHQEPETTTNTLTAPDTSRKTEEQPPTSETRIPKTPEELRDQLKKYGIKATAETFADSKSKYLKSIMLVEQKNTDGSRKADAPYSWQQVEHEIPDQLFLIATKLENTSYDKLMGYIGMQPLTSVTDDTDPTISYHLYQCSDKKNPLSRGAAIVLYQPSRRRKYLSTVEMLVPECTDMQTNNEQTPR